MCSTFNATDATPTKAIREHANARIISLINAFLARYGSLGETTEAGARGLADDIGLAGTSTQLQPIYDIHLLPQIFH